MTNNYSYPRVTVSQKVLSRSAARPAVADTTVLFVPIVTERGPINKIEKIHSLEEFEYVYGELDYEKQGQTALNIANWLTNGGTIYACRVTSCKNIAAAVNSEYVGILDEGSYSVSKYFSYTVKLPWPTDGITSYSGEAAYNVGALALYEGKVYECTKEIESAEGDFNINHWSLKTKSTEVRVFFIPNTDKYEMKAFIVQDSTTDTYPSAGLIPIYTKSLVTAEGGIELFSYNDIKYYIFYEEVANANFTEVTASGNNLPFSPANVPALITAKYLGSYYNDINISFKKAGGKGVRVVVKKNYKEIESFGILTSTTFKNAMASSKYFKIETGKELELFNYIVNSDSFYATILENITLKGADSETTDYETLYTSFWNGTLKTAKNDNSLVEVLLLNKLETPIDLILDAGYSLNLKNAMYGFINDHVETAGRPDIIGIFDQWDGKEEQSSFLDEGSNGDDRNIAVYAQHMTIEHNGEDIIVGPSYFLSSLIPYNDNLHGIQWPIAGTRRAVLNGVKELSENPIPSDKETYFKARVNYAELSSRECAFMSQRTHDHSDEEEYSALSFLNNVRVLSRMVRDLERIGREYLFEFNDSATLSHMSSVLNRYVSDWISNRTLSAGIVEVSRDEYSSEAVNINLSIKFAGTIEVISVNITIE